jgi:hypothetical protein
MRLLRKFSVLGLALLLSVGVGCTATDTTAPVSSAPEQGSPQFGLVGDLTGGLGNTIDGLGNTVDGLGNTVGGLGNTVDGLGNTVDGLGTTVGGLTNAVVGTLGSITDLLLCSPQEYEKVTKTIGPKGGTINVGSHTLVIPKRALSENVRITAEQMKGKTNSVRFSPEGLRFQEPARLTLDYENCALVLVQKKVVYTDEKLRILEVLRTIDLFKKKQARAEIDHFSRYAVAY